MKQINNQDLQDLTITELDEKNKAWLRAADGNSLSTMADLLEQGADIDVTDEQGYTALHKAVNNGHLETVKWLINKHVDLNKKTVDGSLAIDLATSLKLVPIIKLLDDEAKRRIADVETCYLDVKMMRADGIASNLFYITKDDYFPVIADVSDISRWEKYEGVRCGTKISIDNRHWSVDAMVRFDRFEALRVQPFVKEIAICTPASLGSHVDETEEHHCSGPVFQ